MSNNNGHCMRTYIVLHSSVILSHVPEPLSFPYVTVQLLCVWGGGGGDSSWVLGNMKNLNLGLATTHRCYGCCSVGTSFQSSTFAGQSLPAFASVCLARPSPTLKLTMDLCGTHLSRSGTGREVHQTCVRMASGTNQNGIT